MSEELVSPAKAAEIAGCHNDTIRRAIEAGFLSAQRVGRNWVIKLTDLQAWIEAGKPNRRRGTSEESEADSVSSNDMTGEEK